jgi:hypothetical protein
MISEATADILNLIEEKGEEHNTLQRVLMEFLKEELAHLLEISVERTYESYYDASRITVKLKLDDEVISSDSVLV